MEQSVFMPGHDLQMECLWLCFSSLIQRVLNMVKDHWNTHLIHKSQHETVSGRPDELFYLSELYSAQDFKHPVTEEQCHFGLENYINSDECQNDFQEYFNVVDTAELTPNSRAIIDCTEIKCQMLSSLLINSELFSSCKNYGTLRG